MANIFIVEDDPAYLYAINRILDGLGHQVTSHVSSDNAWDAVTTAAIDLLLTDLRFPAGQPNGVALALHARAKNPNVTIIFMTNYVDLVDKVRNDLGPVLLKSLPPMELKAAIEIALKSKASKGSD